MFSYLLMWCLPPLYILSYVDELPWLIDRYPKLPSAARMQMLLRRVRNIKAIAQQSLAGRSGAQSGEATVTEGGEESVGTVTASTEAAEA